MQFKEGTPLYSYEVQRKGGEDILHINYLGAPYAPSLSDFPQVMERTIDALIEKQRMLKDRLLLIGQNLVETKEKNSQDVLEIKKDIEIIKRNMERLVSFFCRILKICQKRRPGNLIKTGQNVQTLRSFKK